MKKLLAILITLVLSIAMLVSCNGIIPGGEENPGENNEEIPGGELPNEDEGGSDDAEDENNGTENPGENEDKPGDTVTYLYNAFTPDEKALFNDILGLVIPFAPNNEYYVSDYSDSYDDGTYEKGINFYTYGNTEADFLAYKALYSGYTNDGTDVDSDGDTWYLFSKGDVYIDLSYYLYENECVIDVYAYILYEDDNGDVGGGGNSGTGGNEGNDDEDSDFAYTDFTSSEKQQFQNLVGLVIPFVSNDEYYVEAGYDDYYEVDCVSFYTLGNTEMAFLLYKANYESSWTFVESFEDNDGDTWYCYYKNSAYVELAYYYYEGYYVIDVYVYNYDDILGGGNSGSDDNGGNGGNSGSGEDAYPDADVITNNNAGLPSDSDGVYDVDFTKAENVKDVTDQGYYLDGCPTVGSPCVLVIPVQFSDITAQSKGYTITTIENGFEKNGVNDYYSVYDYYFISSYGQLTLNIEVLDFWFTPQYDSSYYLDATYDYDGNEVAIGDQLIMDEALAYLEGIMDLSAFDSDGNSIIDAVVLVNTLDIDPDSDLNWAYRYWNIYTDDDGYYYEYDGVSANDYLWMSCGFFHESYDEDGDVSYDNTSIVTTYTAIHEFGHVLGADDYYDTSYSADEGPMGGCDIMDSMLGDHNAYSKFNYGWITGSRLIVTDSSVTVTLEKFSKNGDTVIIANNWDEKLGAYQEYYVVVYYTMDGLNGGDNGYFSRDGIVVYHVNASLYKENYDGEIYYDVYNNNTDASDDYGTVNNLIEYVLSSEGTYIYVEGDTLSNVTDDSGNKLVYSFTVDSISGDYATLTFTKN